jgi:hypothetical protein
LPGFEVQSAFAMGWDTLSNGRLIAAAEEAGFDGMITGDQRIIYQQNLSGRKLALIVLGSIQWPVVRANLQLVIDALKLLAPGAYIPVTFPVPPLRRREFVPPG